MDIRLIPPNIIIATSVAITIDAITVIQLKPPSAGRLTDCTPSGLK